MKVILLISQHYQYCNPIHCQLYLSIPLYFAFANVILKCLSIRFTHRERERAKATATAVPTKNNNSNNMKGAYRRRTGGVVGQ